MHQELEKFFNETAREELAGLRGFITAYLGGSVDDNPYGRFPFSNSVSGRTFNELSATWVREFTLAQNSIIGGSAAIGILEILGNDEAKYVFTERHFRSTGMLSGSLVSALAHLSDSKTIALAEAA